MILCRQLNLCGLKLDADKPTTPRTEEFLRSKNINVEKRDGFLHISGPYSVTKEEIDAFLEKRAREDAARRP